MDVLKIVQKNALNSRATFSFVGHIPGGPTFRVSRLSWVFFTLQPYFFKIKGFLAPATVSLCFPIEVCGVSVFVACLTGTSPNREPSGGSPGVMPMPQWGPLLPPPASPKVRLLSFVNGSYEHPRTMVRRLFAPGVDFGGRETNPLQVSRGITAKVSHTYFGGSIKCFTVLSDGKYRICFLWFRNEALTRPQWIFKEPGEIFSPHTMVFLCFVLGFVF